MSSRLQRWCRGSIQFLVAVAFTQSVLGAVLLAGWLQRWTRRAVFKSWWRRCPGRSGSFAAYAAAQPGWAGFARSPNWIAGQAGSEAVDGRDGWFRRTSGSVLANGRLGVEGLFNVGILTLPSGVLWAFGWWGGWQNSFHKGYEDYLVGPLVSWAGILLFLAVMFYVPMAQARQSATGAWRAFWEWRTVRVLVRHAWPGCAGVAILAAVLNLGVMVLKTRPAFMPQEKTAGRISEFIKGGMTREAALEASRHPPALGPDWEDLTDAEAFRILRSHYFWSGFVVVPALLLLRAGQARVYAGAVIRAVNRGALGERDLGKMEWQALRDLDLLRVREPVPRAWSVRLMVGGAGRAARFLSGGVVLLGWFAFVVEIYVSEFLAYHPVVGWLNQPLLLLPWFRYIPSHLESSVGPWLGAIGSFVIHPPLLLS